MIRLGVASDSRTRHPLHSPYFDIDERALAIGAKILARSAVKLARLVGP
jgi:metal-dependent amidase/aminoacylase/carboxypeptidase family protein